jgi:5-methylcytosine-specific restriction endonuclease McrA
VARGGKTIWENIVASCGPCNHSKGDKIIKPMKAPYMPSYYELVNKRKKYPMIIPHSSWRTYI